MIEVKVENDRLIISLPLLKPTPSASGKTLLVATTRGSFKSSAVIDGKPVVVGVNAYVRP